MAGDGDRRLVSVVRAPRDHPLGRLVALTFLCAIAVVVLYAVAVRTEHGQKFDDKPLAGRAALDPDTVDAAHHVLETVTVGGLAIAAGGLVVIGLVRGRLLLAGSVGVAILGANVTTEYLKHVAFERPNFVSNTIRLGNTYPSGHTTVAMSLAVGAVLVAPRRLRGTAAVAGGAYAAAMGCAVLLTGWHRPSDAVGAAFVTVGWGAAVAAFLVALRGTGREARRSEPLEFRPAMWILTGAGAASLAIAALALLAVAYRARFSDLFVVERGRALSVALVAIIGAVLFMLGLLLVALRNVTLDPPRAAERQPKRVRVPT